MEKKNFIRTSDESTAEMLRSQGFTEITENAASGYCFLNNGKMNFSEGDANVVLTNVMTL